ncbi:MAG: RNA polymerase sigma factor [Planctomycetes bacterium]|nr:RNA polymerase sigma factor [Planctomycetota bacterium]
MARQLRELAPRVLGAVVRRHRDFTVAEDAVQEAMLAAVTTWPGQGVPANPGGWLFAVACRRLADATDADRARARREANVAAAAATTSPPPELPDGLVDETLQMLFLCCHPALTDASAVALVLRAVGGLTTAAIARAFLVPEATMAQRISRAKAAIADAGGGFSPVDAAERLRRHDAVLQVLYLMFNEGHAQTAEAGLLDVDLCDEAIRLARLVHAEVLDHAETAGLLALLLLTDARREARTGPRGELIALDEQDRSRWNRARISEGQELLERTLQPDGVGPFQVQAAIAALHAEAPTFAATDWPQILSLYDVLLQLQPSPVVALNRVVAVAMVHGPAAAMPLVAELARDPGLARGHRVLAVAAHLHERLGDRAMARDRYLAAAERTDNLAERTWLRARAARLA